MPSGWTWMTLPIGMSAALIGRPVGSVTSRRPAFHQVPVRLGAGQRAEVAQRDDRQQPERREGAEQAVADQLRRPRPAPAAPSLRAATASARSSSLERIGLRSLTISSSGISVLAQWIAPAPMQNSARPRPRPSSFVERLTSSRKSSPSGLIAK